MVATRITNGAGTFLFGCPFEDQIPDAYTAVQEEITGVIFKNYAISVSSFAVDTLSPYSPLPAGFKLDSETGIISGSPINPTVPGTTLHRVTAENFVGRTEVTLEVEFSFTINDATGSCP
jgi:hypothetical protein